MKLAAGADVLVHSVMYPPAIDRLVARVDNAATLKTSILTHQTSAEDAGRVAQEAGVKTLVLSHFVPPDDPEVTEAMWREAASRHFRGTVIVGQRSPGDLKGVSPRNHGIGLRPAKLSLEVAAKKIGHLLELVVTLSRVGEEGVVPASFAVSGLDRLLVRSQGHLEFTRKANAGVLSEAVCSAMHDQDRHAEFRGALPGSEGVPRRVKNGRLHVAMRQEVLQRSAGAARVPDERQADRRERPEARASPAPGRRRTARLPDTRRTPRVEAPDRESVA